MDEILVVCPTCQGCARTFRKGGSRPGAFAPRRLVCPSCGTTKEWAKREIAHKWRGRPHDGFFRLPLWLQERCAGQTLWAYNRAHLELIEGFIGATLRERARDQAWGWRNRSLGSRLPKWLQTAKRAVVQKAIARLWAKLSG
jgi:hypothetical protein